MKALVIGVAGTGKSHLVREMKRRGLNSYDADNGLATFVDADANEVEYDPDGGAEWWRSHFYILKPGKLETLLKENETIWVFGDVGGQPGRGNGLLDASHYFDRQFYLRAPARLIRKRLAQRTDNPFGKNPDEIEGTMKHLSTMEKAARKLGFEVVDATLPVNEIIRALGG